jgi:hypothetical protein
LHDNAALLRFYFGDHIKKAASLHRGGFTFSVAGAVLYRRKKVPHRGGVPVISERRKSGLRIHEVQISPVYPRVSTANVKIGRLR